MMMRRLFVAALLILAAYSPGHAQQTAAPAYGAPIDLALAKRVMAAAEAEATRNNWAVAIAVIDTTGDLVMLQRLDNTNLSSTRIARGKARTALEFRRPTKALEEAIAAGGPGLRLLAVEGVTPIEGGLPLIVEGKIIGAIGVSGGAAYQDAQVGKAGADAAKQ